MNPKTKSVLAGLLALACSVAAALYAQRILNENRAKAAAAAQAE